MNTKRREVPNKLNNLKAIVKSINVRTMTCKLEMATHELQSIVIDLVNLYNQRKDKEYEGETLFASKRQLITQSD